MRNVSQLFLRSKHILSCSIVFLLSSAASSTGGSFDDALDATIRQKFIEQRGGPTIVEWFWGPEPPSPLISGTLILCGLALIGWGLRYLILLPHRSRNEEYPRGILWAANVAFLSSIAGYRGADNLPVASWLPQTVIVIVLWTGLAFIAGYITTLAKDRFAAPDAEARKFYETALGELENGQLDRGLWAQCLAKSNGNESSAKAIYLKTRSADLAKLLKSRTVELT
jgi:hypothetical protein